MSEKRICKKCNKELESDYKVCPYCGTKSDKNGIIDYILVCIVGGIGLFGLLELWEFIKKIFIKFIETFIEFIGAFLILYTETTGINSFESFWEHISKSEYMLILLIIAIILAAIFCLIFLFMSLVIIVNIIKIMITIIGSILNEINKNIENNKSNSSPKLKDTKKDNNNNDYMI